MRLAGKAGVVTGTSKGLGREILRALTREGAAIVALSRDAELGQAGVDEVGGTAGRAVFQQGDVTREDDIVGAIERCTSEFGALDLMVANAGILGEGRLHETTNEQWNELVAVHLTGTFWCCERAIEAMRAQGGGAIVTVGSILFLHRRRLPRGVHGDEGRRPRPHEGDRDRLRGRRDPLQLRLPGRHGDADDPAVLRGHRRPGRGASGDGGRLPEQTDRRSEGGCGRVLFLCSGEASFVSGAPLLVDGALTAKTY